MSFLFSDIFDIEITLRFLRLSYFPRANEANPIKHSLTRYNLLSSIQTFVQHGADFGLRDAHGKTPLVVAAEYGNPEFLAELLKLGCPAKDSDENDHTVLHYACASLQNATTTSQLLECGAHVNAKNSDYGDTALHISVRLGDEANICLLLKNGADPDIRNNCGQSCTFAFLNQPVNKNKICALERLLNETTQLNLHDTFGRIPRLLADGHDRFKQTLIDVATRPSTLHWLCRQVLRKAIGNKNINERMLDKLRIPQRHKNYILFASNWTGLFKSPEDTK